MALTDVKVRNAKPADKPVKLTDGNGMHLLIPVSYTHLDVYKRQGQQYPQYMGNLNKD